jgi:La domain
MVVGPQVEYYFSDANLPTDPFMLKQIKKSPEGFGERPPPPITPSPALSSACSLRMPFNAVSIYLCMVSPLAPCHFPPFRPWQTNQGRRGEHWNGAVIVFRALLR